MDIYVHVTKDLKVREVENIESMLNVVWKIGVAIGVDLQRQTPEYLKNNAIIDICLPT